MRLSHVRHLVVCGFVLISAFTSSLPASSRERQSSSEPPSASYRRVAALFIYPSGVSRAFRHICRGGGNLISCKFLGPSPRGSDAAERTRWIRRRDGWRMGVKLTLDSSELECQVAYIHGGDTVPTEESECKSIISFSFCGWNGSLIRWYEMLLNRGEVGSGKAGRPTWNSKWALIYSLGRLHPVTLLCITSQTTSSLSKNDLPPLPHILFSKMSHRLGRFFWNISFWEVNPLCSDSGQLQNVSVSSLFPHIFFPPAEYSNGLGNKPTSVEPVLQNLHSVILLNC